MIHALNSKHAELPALPTERRLRFFTVVLTERRSRLLTENTQGLPIAFHEVKQPRSFLCEAAHLSNRLT